MNVNDEGEDYGDEEGTYDEPQCSWCGVDLYSEEHDWDCPYAVEDEDDDPAECSSPSHPGCRKCEVGR